MYSLQRKVRILRDQLTKKDLQLECCKRKLALLEDGARGKCIAQVSFPISIISIRTSHGQFIPQNERDEAICRAKRSTKQAEKTSQQLIEAKSQVAELKAQLIDAAEHKINSLERARKIDELQLRLVEVENEKSRLIAQLSSYKTRCRSTVDCSLEKNRRDEQTIQVNVVDSVLDSSTDFHNLFSEFA